MDIVIYFALNSHLIVGIAGRLFGDTPNTASHPSLPCILHSSFLPLPLKPPQNLPQDPSAWSRFHFFSSSSCLVVLILQEHPLELYFTTKIYIQFEVNWTCADWIDTDSLADKPFFCTLFHCTPQLKTDVIKDIWRLILIQNWLPMETRMFSHFDIKRSAAAMLKCFDFECSAAAPFQRTLPLGGLATGVVVQVTPADRQLSVN